MLMETLMAPVDINSFVIRHQCLKIVKALQLFLGKCRVATAQGEQGIWMFIFPDRENTGNSPKHINNLFLHMEFISKAGKILKF